MDKEKLAALHEVIRKDADYKTHNQRMGGVSKLRETVEGIARAADWTALHYAGKYPKTTDGNIVLNAACIMLTDLVEALETYKEPVPVKVPPAVGTMIEVRGQLSPAFYKAVFLEVADDKWRVIHPGCKATRDMDPSDCREIEPVNTTLRVGARIQMTEDYSVNARTGDRGTVVKLTPARSGGSPTATLTMDHDPKQYVACFTTRFKVID
jgi:hypothetical protein